MKLIDIEWKNIGSYGNKLQRLEFDDKGKLILLQGKSGSGKSTILNLTSILFYGKVEKMKNGGIVNKINKNGYVKGTVINKKLIAASHIYQMMLDADVSNVKCLTFADADVAEFTVKEDARVTKQMVKDLGLPRGATIGGMVRNGEGILVRGNTRIEAGDHVMVFCLKQTIQ